MVIKNTISSNPEAVSFWQGKKGIFWLILTFLFMSISVFIAVFIFRSLTVPSSTSESIPTPSIISSPTPTPIKYKIKILNGSGINGEATKLKSLLVKQGYQVSSVGNATRFDYSLTEIQATSDIPQDFILDLVNTVSTQYRLSRDFALIPKREGEIIIIIGRTKP